MALIVIVALPLAWVAKERRQSYHEQQVAGELQANGFSVELGGPYDSWGGMDQGWRRNLARRIQGERILRIWSAPPEVSDVLSLDGLTNIQALSLDSTQVSDLTPLAKLTDL
ncbi:MAG TPA: hypothetical protein VGJ26_04420, partial [Pirellulales bacterium]